MINFNQENHQYTFIHDNGNIQDLISVTQFLKKIKPIFEKEKIATIYAKKHNLEVQKVLEDWELKGKLSIEFGKLIHQNIENYLLHNKEINLINEIMEYKQFTKEKSINLNNNLILKLNAILNKYNIHSLESIVYDLDLGIAGTYDCLLQNKETKEYVLIDWKTNKEIKKENKWQKLLSPLEYLDDCEYNNYSLQLSLYDYMLRHKKIKISKSFICHINNIVEFIECDYMKKEIELLKVGNFI